MTVLRSPAPRRLGLAFLAVAALLGLPGCGYNDFQTLDEQVKAAWAEVLSQYQRRSDLIPNIVAKATSIQATPELVNDPAAFNKFQQAQGELSSALSRLLVVTENYPNLRANQAFQDLRVQLEGTENRITVARNKFIAAVQQYNTKVRSVPTNFTAMIFGYSTKPSFTVANEAQISVPPAVSFDKPASR
jgi:LemA protein